MDYLRKLIETYDNNIDEVGKMIPMPFSKNPDEHFTLMPLYHNTIKTHISITLDMDGNFIMSDVKPLTIITPITVDSYARSGTTAWEKPHAIHDNLKSVAGDFMKYTGFDNSKAFNKYIEHLKNWCSSNYSYSKIFAIYKYIVKNTLIRDLVKEGTLFLDDNGKLLKTWEGADNDKPPIFKIFDGNQQAVAIRFNVEDASGTSNYIWEDKEAFSAYTNFYGQSLMPNGICFLTGRHTFLTSIHPTKIRYGGDQAKLISRNPDTFQNGLFPKYTSEKDNTNAINISYEASQKIHNALKWLINKQGFKVGTRVFIIWGTDKIFAPNLFANNPMSIFTGETNASSKTDETTANIFKNYTRGFNKGDLSDIDKEVYLLTVDSFSSGEGRIHINDFRELDGHRYIEKLDEWYNSCKWLYPKKSDITKSYLKNPNFKEIALATLGERKVHDKAREVQKLYTILSSVILDGNPIPYYIIQSVFRNLLRFDAFLEDNNLEGSKKKSEEDKLLDKIYAWKTQLSVGCSLFKTYYKKENYSMTLQTENKDRDYLFGRLLAIFEMIEKDGKKGADRNKQTNAVRYLSAFQQRPMSVFGILRKRVEPYERDETREFFNQLITSILAMFDESEFSNKSLTPKFFLGYANELLALETSIQQNIIK